MVLALCAWLPLAFVWYAMRPEPSDRGGSCGGAGWGETSCGWDAVGLAHAFFGVPFAAGCLLTLAALELFGARAQMARVGVSLVFLVAPWALSAYVVAAG